MSIGRRYEVTVNVLISPQIGDQFIALSLQITQFMPEIRQESPTQKMRRIHPTLTAAPNLSVYVHKMYVGNVLTYPLNANTKEQ